MEEEERWLEEETWAELALEGFGLLLGRESGKDGGW